MKFRCTLATLAICAAMNASASSVLFDNGIVTSTTFTGICDFGPSSLCSVSPATVTVYDNFKLASASTVTGFLYADFIKYDDPENYVGTSWSIWNSSPALPGSVALAQGVSVASVFFMGSEEAYIFDIDNLDINLSNGTYWLGISNILKNDSVTTYAKGTSSSLPGGAVVADDMGYINATANDRAFKIIGDVNAVPEPASLPMVAIGIGALVSSLRYKRRKTT